jgi:hypothetical protein
VGPLEFTLRRDDYLALGGHAGAVRPLAEALAGTRSRVTAWRSENPWPFERPR